MVAQLRNGTFLNSGRAAVEKQVIISSQLSPTIGYNNACFIEENIIKIGIKLDKERNL